jgi:imidazolonepropionase-like amidohydrolase
MSDAIFFHNFSLFDGTIQQIRPDSWLEIEGSKFQRVGSGPRNLEQNAVDLGGRTVIPGLIDAHVHLICPFAPNVNPIVLASLYSQIRLNLLNCILSGVTTVRDVGSAPGIMTRILGWIKDGKAIGPRILRTNSFIIPPGATPEQIKTQPLPIKFFLGGQVTERVKSPSHVRQTVRKMVSLGSDWIKTTHTDKAFLYSRPDPPVFDDACFKALVDEAHNHGIPVAMHQTMANGFKKAVELNVDSMEHAPFDSISDKDVSTFIKAGIPIVPTQRVMNECLKLDQVEEWMGKNPEKYLCRESLRQTRLRLNEIRAGVTREAAKKGYYPDIEFHKRQKNVMLDNLKRLKSTGAIIGCGTDSGGAAFTVFGRFHEEIECLMDAGFSILEALQSATAVNSRILGLENTIGTIEPGKYADFVVLDGNPVNDKSALQRVRMVIKDGDIIFNQNESEKYLL